MRKFANVDIIAALAAVLERNTKHYKTDFEYDKEMFISAAESKEPDDKTMLWLSRESGHLHKNRINRFRGNRPNSGLPHINLLI